MKYDGPCEDIDFYGNVKFKTYGEEKDLIKGVLRIGNKRVNTY